MNSDKGQLRKVCVVGATGFLGAHLVRELLRRGVHVVAAKRPTSNTWRLTELLGKIDVVDISLDEAGSVHSVLDRHGPQCVINAAAYGVSPSESDPVRLVATNTTAASTLLEAAARTGARRFIHLGSCFEYGQLEFPLRENDTLKPSTLYGATKAAASLILPAMGRDLGIETVVFRLFGCWGPLESEFRIVPQIIKACLNRQPLVLTGCEQVRDYSYAPDVAADVVGLALEERPLLPSVMNIGTGEPLVLRDFVLSIASELGGEDLMRFGGRPHRPQEMMHLVADVSQAHRLCGPGRRTRFELALQETVAEFRKRE